MTLDNLKDLYVEQLRDLYNAEQQLTEALPQMVEAASHSELRQAFESHLEETREHVQRIESIFNDLGESPSGEKCEAMEGLIEEGEGLLEKDADNDVLDAGLIAAAQKVEHYEISGYGTVATYAELLDRDNDHEILTRTLSEEKDADKKLNRIAKEIVNPEAVTA